MRASDKGSGETELSLLAITWEDCPEAGLVPRPALGSFDKASRRSVGSEVTDGGLRRVCGFIAGDCLTLRAELLVDAAGFLCDRFPATGCADFILWFSPRNSAGDMAWAFDPSTCWASIAGEFKGLKKSEEVANSGIQNASSGVWAGETRGVKDCVR